MALKRNISNGAYEMDIEYKKQEWGADFHIPTPGVQNSSLTFHKAQSFGFKITLPYSIIVDPKDPESTFLGSGAPQAKTASYKYEEGYALDLGLELALPPGTCYLILSMNSVFEDYVIDNAEPNRFDKLYLYCKKDKDGKATEVRQGQPILWVLPIPDMAYSYQYRRKVMGKIGKKQD